MLDGSKGSGACCCASCSSREIHEERINGSGKSSHIKYLEEHHLLTENAIGLARVHLKMGHKGKAISILDKVCDQIDKINKEKSDG